ncbi:WD repeat-containing protein 83 [Borealophlyctis nickersoniae]|nr:WD repeat-containing protein 83 [Borealophlyctis nickersoniae]
MSDFLKRRRPTDAGGKDEPGAKKPKSGSQSGSQPGIPDPHLRNPGRSSLDTTPAPTDLPIKDLHSLQGHEGTVHFVRYSADGNYCLSGGADRSVRLWNPLTGMCIKKYDSHGKDVYGIAVPGGTNSTFASCGADKVVIVWDVGTGRPTRRFTGHHQRVNAIDYNADATVIFSASYDATVRAWDCRTTAKAPIQVLDEAKDSVEAVQVAGHEVLTGSVDGCIRIYDIRMGRITQDRVGHAVTSACFSGDRNCVLVSTLDSTIRLFDKENGELLSEYVNLMIP